MSRRELFVVFALAAAVAVIYAPALRYQLVWDDEGILPRVEEGWQSRGLPGLLALDYTPGASTGYHRPLTVLSLWVDIRLAEDLGFVPAYHLSNILLHAAAAILLFRLLAFLLPAGPGAALGALLFALHPVAVDSVAMPTNRSDLLAAVFLFPSALLWLKARALAPVRDSGSRRRFFLSLLCFAGAVFSKESALVLPASLLAWDLLLSPPPQGNLPWWRRNRMWLAGWGGVVALALAARLAAGVGLGMLGTEVGPEPDIDVAEEDAPGVFVGRYLRMAALLLVPHDLSVWYRPVHLVPTLAGGAAALLLLLGAAFLSRPPRRTGLLALAWGLAFLLPVAGILPIRGAVLREYYLYLPAAGFALLAGGWVDRLEGAFPRRRAGVWAGAAFACLFAFQSAAHLPVWRDDETLFRHILSRDQRNTLAWENLARLQLGEGRWDQALDSFERLRELDASGSRWRNLALVASRLDRLDLAERAYRAAREKEPLDPQLALEHGMVLERMGRFAEAGQAFDEAMRLK